MLKYKIFSDFDPDMSTEISVDLQCTRTIVKCKIFSNFDPDMSMEISIDLPVAW